MEDNEDEQYKQLVSNILNKLETRTTAFRYYITTPRGGDVTTCPCCNNWIEDEDCDSKYEYDDFNYTYCPICKIIFDWCCSYTENGCSDDERWPSFLQIDSKEKRIINPIITLEEFAILKNNPETKLTMICTCSGYCPQGYGCYTEKVGLGISCCKIDKETREKNLVIYDQRRKKSNTK